MPLYDRFYRCFPCFDSLFDLQGYTWNDKYFTPVGCFLLFNVGNYIGIVMASIVKWPNATKLGSLILLCLSILRFGFIPFFFFCNVSPANRKLTEVWIHEISNDKETEWQYWIINQSIFTLLSLHILFTLYNVYTSTNMYIVKYCGTGYVELLCNRSRGRASPAFGYFCPSRIFLSDWSFAA